MAESRVGMKRAVGVRSRSRTPHPGIKAATSSKREQERKAAVEKKLAELNK